MDEYWNKFVETGKVDDYIKYVNNYYNTVNSKAKDDAGDSQGTNNTGTSYRGE